MKTDFDTGLNAIVIPDTLRDSLFLLAVVCTAPPAIALPDGLRQACLWSIGTRAADAALRLAVELLFSHSQQTGRRLALISKYLIDPNL